MFGMFGMFSCGDYKTIKRDNDFLITVKVDDHSKTPANAVLDLASKSEDVFPGYTVDGAGIILVFHTDSDDRILGLVIENPALKNLKSTKDGKSFPAQIRVAIGGNLADPNQSLRQAAVGCLKNKLFLNQLLAQIEPGYEDQQVLRQLACIIEDNKGWGKEVCVHTDYWQEKQEGVFVDKRICHLTTVKHIQCMDDDLFKILDALENLRKLNPQADSLPRFQFYPLRDITESAERTRCTQTEQEKAKAIYQLFDDKVPVVLNDLDLFILAANDGLKKGALPNDCSQLSFDSVPRRGYVFH